MMITITMTMIKMMMMIKMIDDQRDYDDIDDDKYDIDDMYR